MPSSPILPNFASENWTILEIYIINPNCMTNKLSNLVNPKLLLMGMTMAALLTPTQLLAQSQKTVTGTVLDENGEPLVGATVKVPGTSKGAVTTSTVISRSVCLPMWGRSMCLTSATRLM